MEIAEISPGNAVAGEPARRVAESSRNQFSREDFYRIMIAEMTNQDPFKPLDNQQFLAQVASLQSLESTGRLTEAIETLVFRQQLDSASGLIGKHVVALDDDGNRITGKVERLRIQGDSVQLMLDTGSEVKMDRLLEISHDGFPVAVSES